MRVLVCGSRDYTRGKVIWTILDGFAHNNHNLVIIEGDAKGADKLAGAWADDAGPYVSHECYPANWDKYGKGAGPIRNKQMLDEGKPDLVLAFSDDIENSKGTRNMLDQAKKADVPAFLIQRW